MNGRRKEGAPAGNRGGMGTGLGASVHYSQYTTLGAQTQDSPALRHAIDTALDTEAEAERLAIEHARLMMAFAKLRDQARHTRALLEDGIPMMGRECNG